MNAQIGDIIQITRLSSWTYNRSIAEVIYEDSEFVILTISNQDVSGIDIMDISTYKEEMEILLSSGKFKVISRIGNELTVTMLII